MQDNIQQVELARAIDETINKVTHINIQKDLFNRTQLGKAQPSKQQMQSYVNNMRQVTIERLEFSN